MYKTNIWYKMLATHHRLVIGGSGGNSGFHLGGPGGPELQFSDKITSFVMSNFKETAHFDENR